MVAYNFQARFVPAIETGTKRQTIRAIGKRRHARPGERLQLYTGMRTKSCRKIRRDTVCVAVMDVTINAAARRVWIDGRQMTRSDIDLLAKWDGFASADELFLFFTFPDARPFTGKLIRWMRT